MRKTVRRLAGVAAVAVLLAACSSEPNPSAEPPNGRTVAPEPTQPGMSLGTCTTDDVALAATGWEGATGSLAGRVVVLNVSASPCRINGIPTIELLDPTGHVIAGDGGGQRADPGIAVNLPTGAVAVDGVTWSNWCGAPPAEPLTLRMTAHDGGQLAAAVFVSYAAGDVPRCDVPGVGSSIGGGRFDSPQPLSTEYRPVPCSAGHLMAYAGPWGAAAGTLGTNLVLLNVGGEGEVNGCRLSTAPVVELRDAAGMLLAATEADAALSLPVDLPIEWAATAAIGFADWCSAPPALPLRLDLRVGSTQLDVSSHAEIPIPYCSSTPQPPAPIFTYLVPLAIPGR